MHIPPGFVASVTCGLTAEDRDQLLNPTLVSSIHSVITLQTDCVYWLFTTDFSLIDNVMHHTFRVASWPLCNRRTINSFMMMMMMMYKDCLYPSARVSGSCTAE